MSDTQEDTTLATLKKFRDAAGIFTILKYKKLTLGTAFATAFLSVGMSAISTDAGFALGCFALAAGTVAFTVIAQAWSDAATVKALASKDGESGT